MCDKQYGAHWRTRLSGTQNVRKLATAAAVSLALNSGGAFGLGLGDIEMQSALNQPMDAEIRLTSVRPGELDGMIVQLASEEAFARAGIERSSALTDLTFSVDNNNGNPVIRISSNRPVVEPFLNFLLEVDWPQGRMVREYTVLLDPPVFMTPSATERNEAADQPTVVDRGEDSNLVPTPIERGSAEIEDGGITVDLDDLVVNEESLEASSSVPTPAELLGESDNSLEGGQLLSLDELSDDELVGDTEDPIGDGGEIVSLSDLTAPNTAAIEQQEAELVESFSIEDIEVELAGSAEEITDDLVIDAAGEIIDQSDGGEVVSLSDLDLESDSTIVSLDELEEQIGEPDDASAVVIGDPDIADSSESAAADADDAGVESASREASQQVTVSSGDTLFEIADRNLVGDVSVQQMMMALLTANESSFINNNINLVRAGSILRIPDADEANKLTQAEALAAIGEQQQLWRDYRDSLRGSGATQLAQNVEAPNDAEAGADAAAGTDDPIETAAIDPDEGIEGLSDEAREILENARREILDREELQIVADNAPSNTAASATADETGDNDAALLGEVNRKLQLAREELAATRLRGDDLGEQVTELESTTENLDALVSLRQNEVAKLEVQLEQAREAEAQRLADEQTAAEEAQRLAEEEAAQAEQAAAQASEDAAAEAQRLAEEQAAAAEEAAAEAERLAEAEAAEAAQAAEQAAAEAERLAQAEADAAESAAREEAAKAASLAEQANNTTQNLADEAESAAENAAESATNALTEAGETLEQVELIDGDESAGSQGVQSADTQAADPAGESDESKGTWYQEFLKDPNRMLIAGIGGLGLLGVLGTLLFRGRRRDDPDSRLDVSDEAAFAEASVQQTDADGADSQDNSRFGDPASVAAAGVAGVAAGGAALAGSSRSAADEMVHELTGATDDTADQTLSNTVNELEDGTLSFGAGADVEGITDDIDDEDINPDDTIAEVDVYLAYGLHGQAEELLTKAVESKPENAGYASKLLQTYHAQGNAPAFHNLAEDFHSRFGGEENPEWPSIAAMGQDLRPGNALYASAAGAALASASLDGNSADGNEAVVETSASSVNREFAASSVDNDIFDLSGDQSGLMDQSIDPAFAFDEGDLEATGDFSRIASELAAEEGAGIEFPGFDESGTAANETLKADDSLKTGADELEDSLSVDGLDVDDLDGLSDSVEDLTLDLDQLSGDLELDSADLLNADLNDIDIPELTTDDELLLDSTSAIGESGDEMDTMMDLAKAYIDMGDKDSASSALGEIVKSGSPAQVTEAETLLRKIS